MSLLNRLAYVMEKEKLIYDKTYPIDADVVEVSITPGSDGVIEFGQIIDCNDGNYSVHASDGIPSVIAAEDVSFTKTDSAVTVPVYISGAFRASEVIANPALTAADMEVLREKGIYLK